MKRTTICLLLLAAVIGSCSKSQTDVPDPQSPQTLTVERARAVVEQMATKSGGDANTIIPNHFTTWWSEAREEMSGVLEAVEIPITTSQNLFAIDQHGRRLTVHQRVLVADGQKFRYAASYIMTLIADPAYNGDLWSVEHAGNRQGFTGVILYHALSTGQFVKVNRLNNGESVNQLYVSKYSDENVELLKSEIVRIMCGVRLFQSSFETKSGDDPIDGGSIGEVVIIGDRGNGGHGGSGGLGGGLGKDDTSGNNTNEDDQQCPDLGGGGGGWTPPIPQGPPPMTLEKAIYAINELLTIGKVRVNDVIPNGISTSEISGFHVKIKGREVYIHHFGLAFGGTNHENNYATSVLIEMNPMTTRYGSGYIFYLCNGDGTPGVGSFTVAIKDAEYFKEVFKNAPKP